MTINRNRLISIITIVTLLLSLLLLFYLLQSQKSGGDSNMINSFQECVDAGNPVAESYPEQCFADGKSFSNPSQSVDNLPQ